MNRRQALALANDVRFGLARNRRAAVLMLKSQGHTAAYTARELGITPGQVRRIQRAASAETAS